MQTRERTKKALPMVEGKPSISKAILAAMNRFPDWQMEKGQRVPVVEIDPSGKYHWRGWRKLFAGGNYLKIGLEGVQHSPEVAEVEFSGGEVLRVAVVDSSPDGAAQVIFPFPFFMDSNKDAGEAIREGGFSLAVQPSKIARRHGWRGTGGPIAAAEVAKLLSVMRLETEKDKFPERRKELERWVRIPERPKPGEVAPREKSTVEKVAELERVADELKVENEALRAEIAKLWAAMI